MSSNTAAAPSSYPCWKLNLGQLTEDIDDDDDVIILSVDASPAHAKYYKNILNLNRVA